MMIAQTEQSHVYKEGSVNLMKSKHNDTDKDDDVMSERAEELFQKRVI